VKHKQFSPYSIAIRNNWSLLRNIDFVICGKRSAAETSIRKRAGRHEGMISILFVRKECYSCLLRCGTERNHLFLAPLHTYLDTFVHYMYAGKEYQYFNIFYDVTLKRWIGDHCRYGTLFRILCL